MSKTIDTIETSAEIAENAALPNVHEVHCGPGPVQTPLSLPPALMESPKRKSAAQWAYERVINYIKNFEEGLDANHEVGMGLVGGDAGLITIEGLGFFEPDLITFYGKTQVGARTQLVQHVTQLNLMLVAAPKHIDQAEPNRIGFRLAKELERDQVAAT